MRARAGGGPFRATPGGQRRHRGSAPGCPEQGDATTANVMMVANGSGSCDVKTEVRSVSGAWGGTVLSLRNAVIALVASAALVLVLSGVSAGVFDGAFAGVFNGAFTTAPVPPRELPPIAAHPDVAAPVPVSGPDVQSAPQPAAVDPDIPAPRSRSVDREPVTHLTVYRRVAVQRQPVPVVHQPVPVTPALNPLPVSPPPAPALPVASRSRTVNTEPCSCDGTMRRVPTHWDPPQD